MYQLFFLPAAERELSKLLTKMSFPEAAGLQQALESLQDIPRPANAVKLRGLDAYRLRVGHYRIIYEIDDPSRTITVLRVARRSERTYKL